MSDTCACVEAVMSDWRFIRSNTISCIEAFGDEGLQQPLPRPGLNTFAKHFQEMSAVETSYLNSIIDAVQDFEEVGDNDSFDGQVTAQGLIDRMHELDARLEAAVSEAKADLVIEWPGEDAKGIVSHITNLVMHEALHLGQIIAFCYATDIELPETLIGMWALSPQRDASRE